MNMTAKNKYRYQRDLFNEDVDVGDLIIYASGSDLLTAYVLGLTELGINISKKSGNIIYNDNYSPWDVENHNDKKYLRYINFKIIKKDNEIPEQLLQFCNKNQLR